MYQYTKETIINSLSVGVDAAGSNLTTDRVVAENGLLRILRTGEYKIQHVLNGRVYKTPGNQGKVSTALIDVSDSGTIFKQPGLYRMLINLSTERILSDWARANWYQFGRQIMVEFTVTTQNNTVDGINTLLMDLLKLAVPSNNKFAIFEKAGSKIKVSLTDAYANISSIHFDYYEPTSCNSCVGEFVPMTIPDTATVITPNIKPFATGEWLLENVRFPSYPNTRFESINADETPVVGQKYVQYTLIYDVPRVGFTGMSGVGQKVDAITTHTFYVLESLSAEFDALVEKAFGINAIVENFAVLILNAPTVANDGVTVQLIADTYPIDSTAVIKWELEGKAPGNITLTTDGKLTVDPAAIVGSKFEITATSDDVRYRKATREFEVIAG